MRGKQQSNPGWLRFVGLVALVLVVLLPMSAMAATLNWDRNSEPDMKDYQVYACFTPSCVVIKSPTMIQPGAVVQPAVGVRPSYVIDIAGKEGAAAITARDQSLNESALSVPVPFDQKAPDSPKNPAFQ